MVLIAETRPAPVRPPRTNGHAKPGGPRHFIQVEQAEIVGLSMDMSALAQEAWSAMDDVAAALQNLRFLPAGPERDEATSAVHHIYDRLRALIERANKASNQFETRSRA